MRTPLGVQNMFVWCHSMINSFLSEKVRKNVQTNNEETRREKKQRQTEFAHCSMLFWGLFIYLKFEAVRMVVQMKCIIIIGIDVIVYCLANTAVSVFLIFILWIFLQQKRREMHKCFFCAVAFALLCFVSVHTGGEYGNKLRCMPSIH